MQMMCKLVGELTNTDTCIHTHTHTHSYINSNYVCVDLKANIGVQRCMFTIMS